MSNTITPIANERTYSTRGGLRAGLRTAGLEALNYDTRRVGDKFAATVYVQLREDRVEVERRGFTAVVDAQRAAQ